LTTSLNSKRNAWSHSGKELLATTPGEEDGWPACEAAAADPEGAFTAVAAESSLEVGEEGTGLAAAADPEDTFTSVTIAREGPAGAGEEGQ
jgi:hypothetical protein